MIDRMAGLVLAALLTGGACASADAPLAPIREEGPAPTGPALPGTFEVVGRGPVTRTLTSDLWVFRGGDGRDYAYTGTWGACVGCYGDRMYAWDVTDPTLPTLTDSVLVDARIVNDVKVNAAGTVAIITREGASTRRNGIVVLDLADPAHPKIVSEYTDGLTGGVHNTFIEGDLVYAVHTGNASVHIVDISDPANPATVGQWGLPGRPDKYLHDVWIDDGLAYISYWDDGLVILDMGRGIAGGTPTTPVQVSQLTYRTTFEGNEYGNTHVAYPYTNRAGNAYVFVGDEIFPPGFNPTSGAGNPGGYVHVIDVSDLTKPVEVAKYELPAAGVHNLWVHDDILYTAYYNGGLRALDVSGDLVGDLGAQSREIAVLPTTDSDAFVAGRPFTWGPQVYQGLVFASDHFSGLWIARLRK